MLDMIGRYQSPVILANAHSCSLRRPRSDPTAEGDAEADAWADLFEKECAEAGRRIAELREFRELVGQG